MRQAIDDVRELAERAYYRVCLALGWLLRSVRYSKVRLVSRGRALEVRKRRVFFAPLLVWISNPLMKILGTGVRILPQPDWAERERRIYWRLHGASIQIDADGMLVLPCLAGKTLATLLESPDLNELERTKAVELAVVALAEFHHVGFTHGDAMAENVMIETAVASWFDFETMHEATRPVAWQRADDVRALLVTCLLRTVPERRAETLQSILDTYADEGVTRVLAASFTSIFRRPLAFHLAQAGLSFQCFGEINRLLRARESAHRSELDADHLAVL